MFNSYLPNVVGADVTSKKLSEDEILLILKNMIVCVHRWWHMYLFQEVMNKMNKIEAAQPNSDEKNMIDAGAKNTTKGNEDKKNSSKELKKMKDTTQKGPYSNPIHSILCKQHGEKHATTWKRMQEVECKWKMWEVWRW